MCFSLSQIGRTKEKINYFKTETWGIASIMRHKFVPIPSSIRGIMRFGNETHAR